MERANRMCAGLPLPLFSSDLRLDMPKEDPQATLTPETRVSAPAKVWITALIGFAFWSVTLFSHLDEMQDGLVDVREEVSELRIDFSKMSNSNVTHYELEHWLELLRAAHPEVPWPDFPKAPD